MNRLFIVTEQALRRLGLLSFLGYDSTVAPKGCPVISQGSIIEPIRVLNPNLPTEEIILKEICSRFYQAGKAEDDFNRRRDVRLEGGVKEIEAPMSFKSVWDNWQENWIKS